MSYRTWHNYGYGICTTNIETTPERIEDLLALAPKFSAKVHDLLSEWEGENGWTISDAVVADYEEVAQEFDAGYYGLASLLRLVIEEAEGLELVSCDNIDCHDFVLYPPFYPWQATDKDKDMTEEKLRQIFTKYVSILTDETVTIEYQEVGNGG